MFSRDKYFELLESIERHLLDSSVYSMLLRILEDLKLSDSYMLHPYSDEVISEAEYMLSDLFDSSHRELFSTYRLLSRKMSDDFYAMESQRIIDSIA